MWQGPVSFRSDTRGTKIFWLQIISNNLIHNIQKVLHVVSCSFLTNKCDFIALLRRTFGPTNRQVLFGFRSHDRFRPITALTLVKMAAPMKVVMGDFRRCIIHFPGFEQETVETFTHTRWEMVRDCHRVT